jgi:hypothetical protein
MKELLEQAEVPQLNLTLKPEQATHLDGVEMTPQTKERIQSKLEDFGQVRFDLLHEKNKDAYPQLL